jgi:very-short-patch-repair endonuclease
MNTAEQLVWRKLRAHRMDGRKFRRQHPIGQYIVDFVCLDARLVIEIHGETHGYDSRQALGAQRSAFLEKQGFRDGVTEVIYHALNPSECAPRPSPQPSPLRGEGDSAA